MIISKSTISPLFPCGKPHSCHHHSCFPPNRKRLSGFTGEAFSLLPSSICDRFPVPPFFACRSTRSLYRPAREDLQAAHPASLAHGFPLYRLLRHVVVRAEQALFARLRHEPARGTGLRMDRRRPCLAYGKQRLPIPRTSASKRPALYAARAVSGWAHRRNQRSQYPHHSLRDSDLGLPAGAPGVPACKITARTSRSHPELRQMRARHSHWIGM